MYLAGCATGFIVCLALDVACHWMLSCIPDPHRERVIEHDISIYEDKPEVEE